MAFQDIPPVETADVYLDLAFRKAKARALQMRAKKGPKTRIVKAKESESVKLSTVKDNLVNCLSKILETFPKTIELTEFYNELIKCALDFVLYKKSLGAVAWAIKQIKDLWKIYNVKVAKSNDVNDINKSKTEFYGRVSSVLKQIKKNLSYLQECRRIMRTFPTIKSGLPTVAITGFPNVGKTTLLFRLTGSKPEIAAYAFTTKGVNIAYKKIADQKMQFLDTPGTLNRFEKMNNIEKQAYLAVKLVADRLIYVFDPTEPYPLKDQIKLLKDLRKLKKPIIIYMSKIDIGEAKEVIEEIQKQFPRCISTISELEGRL